MRLLVGGAELEEEPEHLGLCVVRVGCGLVDFIDDHDRPVAELERLLQHETGLRHRTLLRIDDQEHAVNGAKHALDLRAEVGVARSVDDVDLGALVEGSGVLGVDGDAALTLNGVGIHALARAEHPGAAHYRIGERGLAVVDVRDDRDVPYFHS